MNKNGFHISGTTKTRLISGGVAAILYFAVSVMHPAFAQASPDENDYESDIVEILEIIQAGDLDLALDLVEVHVDLFPKSRVGYLLRADILQAMVNNPLAITSAEAPDLHLDTRLETTTGLRHQLQNRWQHRNQNFEKTRQMFPASLIEMGRHEHVMISDMQAGRLYLYRNQGGQASLIRDYYLTVGSSGYGKEFEGDNKTPIGVYSINQHIAGVDLPDLYGKGAYPVNYPNRYDKALNRTGYGIWLHGTPSSTYARAPWASEGCFVLSNHDLLDIEKYIDVDSRTPVILADKVNWVSAAELKKRRQQLRNIIQEWQQDWESLDTAAYFSHYSQENFNFGRADFEAWAKRKRQVNAGKTFIQVDLEIDSLFLYPGETDMFIVTFRQRYLSNNYAGETEKEQYWQRDVSGRWRIVFES